MFIKIKMLKIVTLNVVFMNVVCSESKGIFHESSKIVFQPDDASEYFGFSVVLSNDALIVGAPKARSRFNKSISPGQVFDCRLKNLESKNITCKPLGFNEDDQDAIFRRFSTYSDFFKDDIWFGATIASVPNGKLLICAPRWATPYKDKHLLANGACYIQAQRRGSSLLPLKDMSRQAFMTQGARPEYGEYGTHLNFYAYGQAGMSAKVTENNSVIIGAPGLLQWTGGIAEYKYYTDSTSVYFSLQPITNPYFTMDLGPDDYLGYSVESGIFEKGGKTLYVSGAPRSKNGYGQVIIFEPSFRENDPINIKAKLRGNQLGSYFGAYLCCVDINGDGVTDLLVGAPNFIRKDGSLHYDQGAVYVYLTEKMGEEGFTLKNIDYVFGSGESGARFGSSIASLGDIDGDGFNDIAIGAPFEGSGQGAVYIYRGGNKGLKDKYVQKIVVENSNSFGMSISKGLDIDGNNCNDLAVGAYDSNKAYVFRCIPTMHVIVSIKVPDAMNLHQNASNFTALFCVNATSRNSWPHVKMDFTARITIDPKENRANINGDSEYDVSITSGNEKCDEQVVLVKPTADLSKPISMKYNLEPVDSLEDSTTFLTHAARLSDESVLESLFNIQLTRDCGEDLFCKPWLLMTLEPLSSPYVPGTDDRLGLKVTVLNKEEPSYGAKVHLTLPHASSPKRLPSECSLHNYTVTCDLPGPLRRLESIEWEIEFEYTYITAVEKELNITAKLEDPIYNGTDIERIHKSVLIAFTPVAIFSVSGKARPNATVVVTRDKFNEAADVTFVHYFEVTNFGPSDWFRLEAQIIFPEKVNQTNQIKGCMETEGRLECAWNLPAKVSLPVVLSIKYDLNLFGELLEQRNEYNITTTLNLLGSGQNKTASITTTLVLEPAPPIWPIIVGCVAGVILLSIIVLALYKYGFFSRKRLIDFKRLQEQQLNPEEASPSVLEEPSFEAEHSSLELITNDSD